MGRHLSCYGRETVVSPNLDRLAGEGVLLERCFSTSPICGPSRASLVTGLHPQNHGAYGLMSPPWNWRWKPGVRHMSERLKEAGYVTAVGGVRHEVAREQRPEFDAVLTQEELPARKLAEAAEGFLRERAGDGRPFYLQPCFQRPAPMAQPHVKGQIAPLTELYDLEADPMEFVNLAESPKHAEIRWELDRGLFAHLRRHGDPILNSPMPTPYWQQTHADLPREVREQYARG
ncbi:MAG: sulfatase-like hydrolase/transferase [Kiritimatiellia bacterium]